MPNPLNLSRLALGGAIALATPPRRIDDNSVSWIEAVIWAAGLLGIALAVALWGRP